MVILCLTLWGTVKLLPTAAKTTLCSCRQRTRVDFSTSSPILVIFHFSFYYSQRSGCAVISCSFNLHSLSEQWWASLRVLIGCLYILFGKVSTQILFPLLNWGVFSLLSCESLSTYSGYSSLIIYVMCKYFLPWCDRLFAPLVFFFFF